ncbi:hypothetical protein ElyMa_002335300 [Elysia marginata]|uniref:Uncharacterized protein n=1 Tax=Elysia marginata TaxID=1093978 RepID=A0AAV4G962_9GAST|nr:hypothetical protein ElyMa_002335300 [Elysia marginata]
MYLYRNEVQCHQHAPNVLSLHAPSPTPRRCQPVCQGQGQQVAIVHGECMPRCCAQLTAYITGYTFIRARFALSSSTSRGSTAGGHSRRRDATSTWNSLLMKTALRATYYKNF